MFYRGHKGPAEDDLLILKYPFVPRKYNPISFTLFSLSQHEDKMQTSTWTKHGMPAGPQGGTGEKEGGHIETP